VKFQSGKNSSIHGKKIGFPLSKSYGDDRTKTSSTLVLNICDCRIYTIGVFPLLEFYLDLLNSDGKSRFSNLSARVPTKCVWSPSLLFALKHGAILLQAVVTTHTLGFTSQTTSLIRLYMLGFRRYYPSTNVITNTFMFILFERFRIEGWGSIPCLPL
jgi:hypothetical protein